VDTSQITMASLEVVEEVGLERLTMRLVADRLGVQVGGLYYHLPDKAALLRSMANELCARALAAIDEVPPSPSWPDAVAQACGRLRATLHAHRDGALILASGPLNGSLGSLALMERLIELVQRGIPAERANLAADTLMAYLTGFVHQEQLEAANPYPFPVSMDEMRGRFPLVFRSSDDDEDAMFDAAVRSILAGFVS
jgi:AcrR family transcriptional regulator